MSKTTALCCTAAAALVMTFSCSKSKPAETKSMVRVDEAPTRSEVPPAADKGSYTQYDKNESEHSAPGTMTLAGSSGTKSANQQEEQKPPRDLTSAAAQYSDRDGLRFVRTADIRFQVRDVAEATYDMEDITTRYGGYVTYTELESKVERQETQPLSEDSSMELTWYTVENNITLRIPATRMDSALRAMTPLVSYLDHRTIRADEVSGSLLSEQLKQQQNATHEHRLNNAIDNHQVKSDDLTQAAEAALSAREQADDAILATRTMEQQIRYSTLHFVIYQHQAVRHLRVANPKAIPHYERPLLLEVRDAAIDGWYILRNVLVFVVHCWAFMLVGIVGYVVYKMRRW